MIIVIVIIIVIIMLPMKLLDWIDPNKLNRYCLYKNPNAIRSTMQKTVS
jgi:hypothetical protein